MTSSKDIDLKTQQGLRLIRAFESISNPSVREEIIAYVEEKARSEAKRITPSNNPKS